jgi:hypothetical protein
MENLPEVVSRERWLAARRELLAAEKEVTRARDRVNAGCGCGGRVRRRDRLLRLRCAKGSES